MIIIDESVLDDEEVIILHMEIGEDPHSLVNT